MGARYSLCCAGLEVVTIRRCTGAELHANAKQQGANSKFKVTKSQHFTIIISVENIANKQLFAESLFFCKKVALLPATEVDCRVF
jgi:hypothetical protein